MPALDALNHVQYRLSPEGSSTTLTHWAMGQIPKEHLDGMGEEWAYGLERVGELTRCRSGANPKEKQR